MTARNSALLSTAFVAALAFAGQATATPHGVKVGVLTCHVESGWGYIVGSSKNMRCEYHPNHDQLDVYTGSISKIGMDIGYTGSGTVIWDVVAPTSDTRRGALSGDYAGATASATAGIGVGANVLIGGLDKSIALQPVSVMGNTGLDVSAGIGAISLRAEEPPVRLGPATYVAPQEAPAVESDTPPAVIVPPQHKSLHRRHITHYVRKTQMCPKP
jgi:hypothetical protein